MFAYGKTDENIVSEMRGKKPVGVHGYLNTRIVQSRARSATMNIQLVVTAGIRSVSFVYCCVVGTTRAAV